MGLTILFCWIYEPNYSSANFLAKAFRDLGHRVITCGPRSANFKGTPLSSKHDIPLYDNRNFKMPWGNYTGYTFQEVLSKVNEPVDLIFQAEPNFHFMGQKPQNIPCAYWMIDNHRGPLVHLYAAKKRFDYFFVAQKYYMPHYTRELGKVHLLPFACDPEYHKVYPDEKIAKDEWRARAVGEEKCDIVWAGNSGIIIFSGVDKLRELYGPVADTISDTYPMGETLGNGQYVQFRDEIPDWVINSPPDKRFANWHSREYVERAQHLMWLNRDFHVRMYGPIFGEGYGRILNKAPIVFNHSLRNDVTLRIYEGLACQRLVITDEVKYQDELFEDGVHYRTYGKYYQADNVNFELDYKEVKGLVDYYLKHEDERLEIARGGQEHVYKHHKWTDRAKKVLDVCGLE